VAAAREPTPSQTVGPFFAFALPFEGGPEAATLDSRAIRIEGQLLDGGGAPVPDGLVEIWQGEQFARCRTDSEGAFHALLSKPAAAGGPEATSSAPYLNVTVFARGLLRQLATRIYFPDEPQANQDDPVLQLVEAERRSTLIARADGGVLHFDIRLQGDRETVFFGGERNER
jgi:protocatechuate 3,4-dioxygenase, alpha subunit